MAKEPSPELKHEHEEAEKATKIRRRAPRELREVDRHSAANPSSRAKKIKGIQLAVNKPSYCLKIGVGGLQGVGESLRFQHRRRLFNLLQQLMRQYNWAEASGVLSVLLQGSLNDRSLSGNRAKYMTALELLRVIKGENINSRKIQSVYELWMARLGLLKYWSNKKRFTVQLEFILTCLQHQSLEDAYQAALCLMQEHGFDGHPIANFVVGLTFCQLWYSDIPKEFQLTELDSSSTHIQSEIPLDNIYTPVEYSYENNAHEARACSVIQCDSNTSVANDKEVDGDGGNQVSDVMDIDSKIKKETSHTSFEPQEFSMKSAEASGNSDFSNHCGELPHTSIFFTQGLPSWLLPMKLPSSDENLEDTVYAHRKLHNSYYKSALKHLRVALYSTPPVTQAIHPLIQMLILGDQVDEALHELETLSQGSDIILQLRLKAGLLEHFDSGNYVQLCTCFEDILKKDPACGDSLARLILMHQRGDYDTQMLVEMIALHLDASHGTCDAWRELSSCFLKLSQCEGDRISTYGDSNPDSEGCLDDSNKIPELFTSDESGKEWRVRFRWWLKRHFHGKILLSDIATGNEVVV